MQHVSILTLPGWTNSGPDHWQSHWERAHPGYRRVQQADWDRPERGDWLRQVEAAVWQSEPPVILVAHSLGCMAAVGWVASTAAAGRRRVAGAFLVAPADVERPDAPAVLHAWRPVPLVSLPFASVVVASRNDDFASFARSEFFARAWRSRLVDAGLAGHIHAATGYGPWPEGQRLLGAFVAQVVAEKA